MSTLSQLETQCANELGLNTTSEKTTIDDALNLGVQRVLEDTHCYVVTDTMTGFDGSSTDFTIPPEILEIVTMYPVSVGTAGAMERVGPIDLIALKSTSSPTGSPTQYYALNGANMLQFWPPPAAADSMVIWYVPIPTALSASGDDPSSATHGGVPAFLHRAIFYFACSELASYDDDQTSGQGQRYRDWYDKEIERYRLLLRRRGGTRNQRARVGGVRPRRFRDNSTYFSGGSR